MTASPTVEPIARRLATPVVARYKRRVTLRDDERISAAPDVLSRTLDGEAVLLDLKSGTYFGLNDVGTKIWELIARGATVAEIREQVLTTFEVDEPTAARDIEELLAELVRRQLIVRGG
jgi:hypothetical protein